MGGPFGQWAHQYDLPPRTHRVVSEVWLPRATNIQAAYVDYIPFLFSLATDFPLFNLDAGSMPSLLDNTVSLPFLIQPRHGLVCMK